MYKTEEAPNGEWFILDPDSDYICKVSSRGEADALLTHLNKG